MKKLKEEKRKIKRLLKSLNANYASHENLKNLLVKNGYIFKKRPCSSGGFFLNKKNNIVVKIPYLCDEDTKYILRKHKKYIIPTEVIEIEYEYEYPYIFIQPLANMRVKNKSEIEDRLYDELPDSLASDIHYGNFGLYRNKIVMIDW